MKQDINKGISIDISYLADLIETIEQTIIVLDDNDKIQDSEKCYDSKNLMFELNDHLKYLRGEK